jgi:hypothetical protein
MLLFIVVKPEEAVMDTLSMAEIREQRRQAELRLPLEQRELAALAKLEEAAEELQQVRRELAELDSEGTPSQLPAEEAEHELKAADHEEISVEEPVEVVADEEPSAIGERTTLILKERAGTWLAARPVMAELYARKWMDADEHHAIMRVRHTLRRIAISNPHVECDESGTTKRYRYVTPTVGGGGR